MKRNPVTDNDEKDVNEQDEEMEDEEKACASKKSQDLTEDDLMKAMNKLEIFATEEDPNARKKALLAKAQEEDLDKSEQDELMQLISGGNEVEIEEESITKGLDENETIQKSMDVSDFLAEQTNELTKALNIVDGNMTKSDSAQREFNLMLARGVTSVGKLVKSIAEKLDAIGEQPVRKPTSVQPLEKSFAGQKAQSDSAQLSKSQVLDRLTGIVEDQLQKGGTTLTPFGVDLANEAAKFEMTGQLDPRVLKMVSESVN